MRPRALLFASALALAACAGGDETADGAPGLQAFDGTVAYQDLEGGFYGIETTVGERLLPTNLPAAFEEDGLAVHVTGRTIEDLATIQMWGHPFEIASIERR